MGGIERCTGAKHVMKTTVYENMTTYLDLRIWKYGRDIFFKKTDFGKVGFHPTWLLSSSLVLLRLSLPSESSKSSLSEGEQLATLD